MNTQNKKAFLTLKELVIFAMFGTLMFCSKKIMEALPNIHLIGMFIMVFTIVFRGKALIPLYIYIFLDGLFGGFALWWYPYLYTWAILWVITMLLPKRMPRKIATVVYPIVCGLFGLAFGALYAPAQALMFGFNFEKTIMWIIAGLPFDITHAFGNLVAGILILPMCDLLYKILPKEIIKTTAK